MHIILLNSRHGSARTIHLNLRWLLLSVVVLLALSLGAGAALGARWLTAEPVVDVSLAKALDQASRVDPRLAGAVPSTKGTLTT